MVLFRRQLCEVVVNATVIWQFFYKRLYLFLRIEPKERIQKMESVIGIYGVKNI